REKRLLDLLGKLMPADGGAAGETAASGSGEIEESGARLGSPSSPPPAPSLGNYRIVRAIGEGGMGAVYEAEQDRPRRTVALKVIRPGYASRHTLRRFE